MKHNIFDVLQVNLQGKNAIEASAGTGKTYSIAVLVLRLMLEKKMLIEEILMVTFTNAAVAELSERIRKFVKDALVYVKTEIPVDNTPVDNTIIEIVHRAIERDSEENILLLLKRAVAYLDEASVFTIHGFCQRTLKDFAFETGEIFDATVITDEAEIINRAVNRFWRKQITTKSKDEMKFLVESKISKSSLSSVVKEALNGKEYFVEECPDFEEVKKLKLSYAELQKNEIYLLRQHKNEVVAAIGGKTAEKIADFIDNFEDNPPNPFFTQAGTVAKAVEKKLNGHPVIRYYEESIDLKEKCEKVSKNYLFTLYKSSIDHCIEAIEQYKENNSMITQNDLINRLYHNTESSAVDTIQEKLSEKYKALFIDEFQDTDEKQYRIFTKLFSYETITFFIGDPKQSIYGFRGADLDSYNAAIATVDQNYTMDKNFRSDAQLVEAMNRFFHIENPFNDDHIEYMDVNAGKDSGNVTCCNKVCTPFTILEVSKEYNEQDVVAKQIAELLDKDRYKIGDEPLSLKHHSIGVLTRSKKQAAEIKQALTRRNIPSVMVNDAKVLESDVVQEFLYFLEAVISPDVQNIKKALLSTIVGFSPAEVQALASDRMIEHIEFFKKQYVEFEKKGVFVLCQNILREFSVKRELILENRLKELSNIQQLIELLYKKEKQGFSTIEQFVSWVKRVRSGLDEDGDEYEERVESDEEAVQIVTIHKSKGLAYDIVFAPFLNRSSRKGMRETVSYKEGGIKKFSSMKTDEQLALEEFEDDKEQRRLIYVAITRAKHKIYVVEKDKNPDTQLFLDALKSSGKHNYDEVSFDDIEDVAYKKVDEDISFQIGTLQSDIRTISFTKSFSSLNGIEHQYHKQEVLPAEGYDEFIFHQLRKGPDVGTFLHEIFENIDFTNSLRWEYEINELSRLHSVFDKDQVDGYVEMIENTVHADLKSGFTLKDITLDKRLVEMEFYFKTEGKTTLLEEYLQANGFPNMKINSVEIDGAIMGFIDLLFEHEGKYYILDWKSNHLGYSLENYNEAGVTKGMDEANYNLQYLIYGVATKRFLESRGLDFAEVFGGVLYLFLRGLRSGKDSGVFFRSGLDCLEVICGLEAILSKK